MKDYNELKSEDQFRLLVLYFMLIVLRVLVVAPRQTVSSDAIYKLITNIELSIHTTRN